MNNYLLETILLAVALGVIVLAAQQIGLFAKRFRLPLISGFILAGILTGPFVLGLMPEDTVERLRFIDEAALAFIAFAAGSELYFKELRNRLRSIGWVTAVNAVVVPVVGGISLFLLADFIPFMAEMSTTGRVAAALLGGAIMVARSPSSAIAIVQEMRAKGPFTKTTLGVTMVTDVVVIVLFAVMLEISDALLTNLSMNLGFVLLLLGELLLALLLGFLVSKALQFVLSWRAHEYVKGGAVLVVGYFVFYLSHNVRHLSHAHLSFELLLEPLLICMIASFLVTNYSRYRLEFLKLLSELSPAVYVIFFTLVGISLKLDVLAETWLVALVLFLMRVVGIAVSSFAGGVMAGDPMSHNRLGWMAYLTQAGVGLGLAQEVAVIFPEWGGGFATEITSVIVLSQIVGPPFYKWALARIGEAHTRARPHEADGRNKAIIFGVEGQAWALAQQLERHNWIVDVACLDQTLIPPADSVGNGAAETILMPEISVTGLRDLGLEEADALVAMLSDEENYRICEIAYEHFGVEIMVVRLQERRLVNQFHELGALVVEPGTAIVHLLEQFVRSPAAASLLLGMDETQDVVEIEVRDHAIHGLLLRELRLPPDTLVLSVHRDGRTIVSHGYTRLEVGDKMTLVGSPESLAEIDRRFGMVP